MKLDVAGFDVQRAALRHRVARVDGQVQDQLLHLPGVGADPGHGRGEFHF